ncbi:DUF2141 domain-containing protein [Algibacter mikhailovii]|uniref:DUF2141 domain-containing protein n=1 Tax=Algibacter mikhailovii TaxID=425498 RepID=A0A918V956_9FLAO|nr:DUF2141 domain-containing protein [Algibacter mikhailovii]GGZ80624.1 hypothetical protein GCM10007028_17470 [Algibacter mikhailovii]
MNLFIKITVLFMFLVALNEKQEAKTFDIKVIVKNAESDKGKMFFGLHDNEDDFLKKEVRGEIELISKNTSSTIFKNVPVGTYAISVFHDENDNGQLDTNSFGIPNESYGCSNNARGFMGPPKWKNAKFELRDKNLTLTIDL